MRARSLSPARLVDDLAERVLGRSGRVRVLVDGPPPTGPATIAADVAEALRTAGRAAVAVDAGDYLRAASVRLEHGRVDPDEYLDGWLDVGGLLREVLDPLAPGGSGRVLPRLWDASADRSYRERYVQLPTDGVVLLGGSLLLGRGLPAELSVHLRMSAAALERRLAAPDRWTLPAYARYEAERNPQGTADVVVLADHPNRPALRIE